MTTGSEIGDEIEVVPASSIVRIDCPVRAAELGRWLAERSLPDLSTQGEASDASEIAAALLRGDLVLVRRSPPELDDYDGSAGRPLRDLAAAC
jgi:hypothetical protein